ncbi:MAG TPA: hypothetical protein VF060_29605 [Trebonia sp.]
MTAPTVRSNHRTLLGRLRLVGAVVAAFALAALAALGPTGHAQAASGSGFNQMTGIGPTVSAVTVKWTQGLLNDQNQPITASGSELSPNTDRQAFAAGQATTSPLSFMYPEFKNLQVTVSQTQDISHQGITVKWTGGVQTNKTVSPQSDFLQMMECYGDSSTGPNPQDCEYGSQGMLASGAENPAIGNRFGFLCAPPGKVVPPSAPNGVAGLAGDPGFGCDPYESDIPTDCNPADVSGDQCTPDGVYEIPFVPVDDPANPVYGQENLLTDFAQGNTNEVQGAESDSKGNGEQQFQTLTDDEAPHLGCGALEDNGKPRNCWLVIVPRGSFEPNGFQVRGTAFPGGYLQTSPLSAANWAQRIQIHLDYAPLGTACPPTVLPYSADGTPIISRAMSSWELPLNIADKCAAVYSFGPTAETTSTKDLQAVGKDTPDMSFTTIPIGSEATRYPGGKSPRLPRILYAPVAVTAMGFGFNINLNGYDTTPVNLTPQLLARALTQVYQFDLPDDVSDAKTAHPGPKWAQHNPDSLTQDPAFHKINPNIPTTFGSSYPLAPLLTEDHYALYQQIWQWVQKDAATRTWLDRASTAKDPVQADPFYVNLKPPLGKTPAPDAFPRAYNTELDLGECTVDLGCTQEKAEKLGSLDLLPYAPDIDTAAAWVLAVNDTSFGYPFSTLNKAPDGSPGWWSKVGTKPPGLIFMWTASDMPDLAAYGLVSANLCNASGTGCVGPTLDSVTKALNSATTDSHGLLEINPAKVPAGGYPLTQVVYAAVPTNQSAAALNAYADLIQYASTTGQTTGANPGNLPPGYLPLTAKLKAQAASVVKQIRAAANATKNPTASSPGQGQPGSGSAITSGNGAIGGTGANGSTSGASSGGSGVKAAPVAASPTPQRGIILQPTSAALSGSRTKGTGVSAIKWVLVTIFILGAAGVLAGTVLRADWRSRRRSPRGQT